ncbi:MAG: DNA topoisomerase IB [Candidatus Dormibacteria bacterium]
MAISRSSAAADLEDLLAKQQPAPLLPSEEMADPRASAEAAGLRYVTDLDPGIHRTSGKRFRYTWPDGTAVKDRATMTRINALAIPPAYTDVWICRDPQGHLQAVGRDDRGRKQYRYHEDWRTVRDAVKFHRMLAFGEALPRIREQVSADLRKHGLPREKVVATVVAMLEQTLIRVGNEQYRQQNQSYGVTTLRNRHVSIKGGKARLRFTGKSGKPHDVEVDDPRLVRVVAACLDIPGQELFQWLDDEGQSHPVGSDDVNAYLQEVTGEGFTAKDFRTWAGTVLAGRLLRATGPVASERAAKTEISRVIKEVAEQLRNTPAVCRKSYVHPAVIDAFVGGFIKPLTHETGSRAEPERSVEEDALLELLREGTATVKGAAEARSKGRRRRRAEPRSWSPRVLKGR